MYEKVCKNGGVARRRFSAIHEKSEEGAYRPPTARRGLISSVLARMLKYNWNFTKYNRRKKQNKIRHQTDFEKLSAYAAFMSQSGAQTAVIKG